jgi:hypothetical protein
MCEVCVKFANGSATRSTLVDTRYVIHVHNSFATGIVLVCYSHVAMHGQRHSPLLHIIARRMY